MQKVKKIVLNQSKRKLKFLLDPVKLKVRSRYTRNVMHYAKLYKNTEVDEYFVMYQVRDGKSMTDSPYAIFNYLIHDKSFEKYQHVWIVSTQAQQKTYAKKYRKYNNIKFIIKESEDYLYYLTKCKYLINNATFPAYFTKKPEQIYINTWHGTPLKLMGLDIKDNLIETQNTIKNFLSSDYLISPNRHTTEIFKHAFKLQGINEEAILEVGYPRIDATFNTDEKEVKRKLKKQGITMSNEPILLFSPTWRGAAVHNPEDTLEETLETVKILNDTTQYQVLLKVHPFIFDKAKNNKKLKPYLVNDVFDTNELLSVVDLLVTDYSSIFFDFLVTDKPIIFYTPDYEAYEESRGLYLDVDTLPGPSIHTTEALVETIQNEETVLSNYQKNYESYKAQFVNLDDGYVTKRVVNQVFNNIEQLNEEDLQPKKSILIYPGGMKPNGITTSINNLLENINYDQYDVTIFTQLSKDKDAVENIKNLNENVRVILRKGPLLATTTEYYRNKLVQNRSLRTKFEEKIYPENLYKREFRKTFGNSKFDVAIDFSGYAMFWSELVLASEAKTKLVYLHSDMKMDMERTVNGLKPHYVNLKGIISMYPSFDKLVSVSEITKDENLKKIGNNKTSDKFKAAVNTINLEKINNQVNDDNDIFMKNGERVIVRQIDKHISSVPFHKKDYKIMAMGRLSPEKGFDNLIKSFEEIVKNNASTKLYILGDGPLRNQLNQLIISLNLTENIFLMGQKRNPFYIMKECDLFVLPSYYEGQSMVLLEALTIGINVLASDIPANQYVLDYGKYGMLSDNDAETLTTSIQQFIDNDTNEYAEFDAELYNKDAINQFYNLFRN